MKNQILTGDCLDVMRTLPDGCADVTFTSPPYEDCRTYGVGFKLVGQDWVDWMIPRVVEMCRVTSGLVFINAAGKVRDFKYSPVVEWLVADLTRLHGLVCGPAPYVFHRVGIPGSGGPHYHRRDWEPIYAFALEENLPPKWSDNTAFGHPPKWAPGGEMSHRLSDGARVREMRKFETMSSRAKNGNRKLNGGRRSFADKVSLGAKVHTKHDPDAKRDQAYLPPNVANPGNIIRVAVGGGLMGSNLAHQNEAPFPEELVRRFVAWYVPPNGTILDPFSGSGTVASVAKQEGRNFIAIDVRPSQSKLAKARTAQEMLL